MHNENKFWAKVAITNDISDCWLWTGGLDHNYGILKWGNRRKLAHVMAYYFATDVMAIHVCGDQVRHLCNTPLCCNPFHLAIGTMADNGADRTKDYAERLKRPATTTENDE